jgi:hypothetical protein
MIYTMQAEARCAKISHSSVVPLSSGYKEKNSTRAIRISIRGSMCWSIGALLCMHKLKSESLSVCQ